MLQTKEVRYTSRSITPPPKRRSRSRSSSRSRVRSRSRSQDTEDARNPGNNLYVTGLSTRVTSSDLEKYFSKEGKVLECHVVVDPRTRESRGFGFVTMETLKDADRCVKYLDHSVLEGRLIKVEKCLCGRQKENVVGLQHLESIVVQEKLKLTVVDALVATHLIDLGKEDVPVRIHVQGVVGSDHVHPMQVNLTENAGRGLCPRQATENTILINRCFSRDHSIGEMFKSSMFLVVGKY